MKLPKRALKVAQSVAGLARALHVSPSTVNRWKTKLTDVGAEKVKRFLARADERIQKQKEDLKRIYELMNLAGEIGKLPTGRTGSKPRVGKLTIGVQHTKRFSIMLSLDVIDDIEVWLHSIKKKFPKWQLLAVLSQYGLGEHRGYKTVYHQLAPDAGDFAISSNVATPRSDTLKVAMSHLRQSLEAMVENGKVLAFLHTVTVFNYYLRSRKEIAAKETQQRRAREEERLWREKKELAKKVPSSTDRQVAKGWGLHTAAMTEALLKHHMSQRSSASSPSSKTKARAAKPKRALRSAPKASKASMTKSGKSSKRSASLKKAPKKRVSKSVKPTTVSRGTKKVTRTSLRQSVRKPVKKTSSRSSRAKKGKKS